jgi:hypothetical protein
MPQWTSAEMHVDRGDLRQVEVVPSPAAERDLADGEVRLAVDKFGLTANNVTYAAFGEAMSYWEFFPAPAGKGIIPVWGYADVAESAHEEIAEGQRVFGYLPFSSHAILAPGRVAAAGFRDVSEQRAKLPGAYQLYTRTAAGPPLDPPGEDAYALFRPLFVTSFLIEDFLADSEVFGARQVVFASASSKTALGTAFLLSQRRPQDVEVVGLTSPGNAEFCRETGYYDEVVTYDELDSLAADVPTVFVDMAGDGALLVRVHTHFAGALKHSCIVGATHWEEPRNAAAGLPGPPPQFFFAPARIEQRAKDWGPGGVEERYAEAWSEFGPSAAGWLEVEHASGPEGATAAYLEVLEGRVEPRRAHVLTLREI